MKNDPIVEVFDNMGVEAYEKFNLHFQPVAKGMYLLTMLTLKNLPEKAKILCVGVGTGADIIDIAQMKPGWKFTGIEPSKTMLEGCKKNLESKGLTDRCDLFQGYLSDFQTSESYDAVLCFFVFHFIPVEERKKIFADIQQYLKPGGTFVHAEISCDFESRNFSQQLEDWKSLHGHAGATEEKLAEMQNVLKNQLSVLSPQKTEALLKELKFDAPTLFFQSFLIRAWHSKKTV